MPPIRTIARLLSLLALLIVSACGTVPPGGPQPGTAREINELTSAILALGPGIDPEEAARAARISYDYTYQLALEYGITDPPLVHNTKVNMGLRPRGLCWHWAEDMETRLEAEDFQTLDLHRAIANADNPFRIDHSTAIISRMGDGMIEGIVIDPWRKGGVLFWSPLLKDTDYKWRPQQEVLQERRDRLIARGEWPPAPS